MWQSSHRPSTLQELHHIFLRESSQASCQAAECSGQNNPLHDPVKVCATSWLSASLYTKALKLPHTTKYILKWMIFKRNVVLNACLIKKGSVHTTAISDCKPGITALWFFGHLVNFIHIPTSTISTTDRIITCQGRTQMSTQGTCLHRLCNSTECSG